jgi:tetratricopeptide (TPR) repeat protein
MRLTVFTGVALAALAGLPAQLVAQPGAVSSGCSIDVNSPKELSLLSFRLQQARAATAPEARAKSLMEIAKELDTKPERFAKNPAGYQSVLSQVLMLWGNDPKIATAPTTRGALGFLSNPTEAYDIVTELDKSFKAQAAAVPACEGELTASRQNEVWLANTRAALDAQSANKLDDAEGFAKRAMVMVPTSPYAHYVLANAANAKEKKKEAIMHWGHVVKYAGADSNYRDLKNNSQYYLAITQLELASAASGAEQQQLGKDAADAFKTLITEQPDNPDAANIMNNWADALTLAKDTAAIPGTYASLLAAPDKASDLMLTMGGVIATRVNKSDDALKLFEAAARKNVAARDALRNIAATYYGKDQFEKMFEPTKKLTEIDPNNYDAWMFYAYAAQGLARGAKTPVLKKAWTDSLVKYQTYAEALPAKVDVQTFMRGSQNVSVTLGVEQVAAAGGSYDVTVEFVDAAGGVIATATESTGALKKGDKKAVTLKATGKDIAGFRYKALK